MTVTMMMDTWHQDYWKGVELPLLRILPSFQWGTSNYCCAHELWRMVAIQFNVSKDTPSVIHILLFDLSMKCGTPPLWLTMCWCFRCCYCCCYMTVKGLRCCHNIKMKRRKPAAYGGVIWYFFALRRSWYNETIITHSTWWNLIKFNWCIFFLAEGNDNGCWQLNDFTTGDKVLAQVSECFDFQEIFSLDTGY